VFSQPEPYLLYALFAKALPSKPCDSQDGSAAACPYHQDGVFNAPTTQLQVDMDILQLALNSSDSYTAREAVQYLRQPLCHLQPHQARQLLLTAAANHSGLLLLQDVLLCQGVQQHIYSAMHEAVIERLLRHDDEVQESVICLMCIVVLPDDDLLPAAAQLARDIVARLLLAALQRGSYNFMEDMLANRQEELHNLTSDQLESMLLAALERDNQQCVRGLCKLPGAAELSGTDVSKLLWAALQLQDWGCAGTVDALCRLPAVAHISPQDVVRLLEEVCSLRSVDHHHHHVTHYVCWSAPEHSEQLHIPWCSVA
jgi:hypothetical protein